MNRGILIITANWQMSKRDAIYLQHKFRNNKQTIEHLQRVVYPIKRGKKNKILRLV